ncbi:g12160 [Coccomyxa viridis]|uniref:G12160 protein n=1 Tax=Coccomyxa viridis TaxID=1274662 RepID=A0ABP1G9P4_9CHLO
MDTQPHVAHENGDVTPKVAIKGADGGPVQSQGAPHAEPAQPKLNTPFQSAAVAEEHSSTGPAVPASADESRHGLEAKKAQEPWAKGMEESAMHTPMQRDGDQTSKDLGPSEAGHSRRWVKVPKGWYAKKGNAVMDGLFVGDAIGKGMQGGVYNLVDKDGNADKKRVLKAKHRYALLAKVKREWEIGRCIHNIYEPERALPGYMGTGEGVVTENGNFVGMILERLDGKGPNRHIMKSEFNDIHYMEEFLFCLFNALDIGQKAIGFHHSDLRISNVMELNTKDKTHADSTMEASLSQNDLAGREAALSFSGEEMTKAAKKRLSKFRIIDYGLANFSEYYPQGRVDVGGPTHAVPKRGPLHISLGKFDMSLPLPMSMQQMKALPKVSALERFYRFFWRNKGDIYHVLWDLTRFVDGRVWPQEDEKQVKLMMAMIHHCTGVRLKAWFRPRAEADENGMLKIPQKHMVFSFIQHNDGFLHILRVRAIRLQAWFRPHNPGMTAAEALCAPFFTAVIDPETAGNDNNV